MSEIAVRAIIGIGVALTLVGILAAIARGIDSYSGRLLWIAGIFAGMGVVGFARLIYFFVRYGVVR